MLWHDSPTVAVDVDAGQQADEAAGRLNLMFQIVRSHHTRTPLAVIPGSAGRATIKYRPVHSDVVRYESGIARLRITARAASMVEVYRKLFGRVLFGDDMFFYGDPVCSLRVLQDDRQAALDRHRVYGVGRVWMTECIWERSDGQRLTIRATDCFDADLATDVSNGTSDKVVALLVATVFGGVGVFALLAFHRRVSRSTAVDERVLGDRP